MTDHPARWFIAVLVVFIACRSAVYLGVLRHAITVLRDARPRDELAIDAAQNRYGLVRWLLVAQGWFVAWAIGVVTTDVAVTWHTLLAFVAVFAGQLAVAWGIRSSAKADATFVKKHGARAMHYCNDIGCPYRIEREAAARAGALWRTTKAEEG